MPVPVCTAGADQAWSYGSLPKTVTLSGAATESPTGWQWVMLSVPPGSTANVGVNGNFTNGVSTLQNPQFTCDVQGCYVLQLKAQNASGWSDPDAISDRDGAQTAIYVLSSKLAMRLPGYKLYKYDGDLNQTLLDLEAAVYLPETQLVYVDGGRTDTYTADGTLLKPHKTINAALTAITDNSASKRYTIRINPGTYEEQITCKPYVDMQGVSRSSVIILNSTGGYTVRGTAAVASGGPRLSHMSIDNTWSTGGYAVEMSGGGLVILNDCYAHSTNSHAVYSDDANVTVHYSALLSDTSDGLHAITGGAITLEQSLFWGKDGTTWDIYTGIGTEVYLDGAVELWNWRSSINGDYYLMTPSDFVGNNSSVTGDSVSNALDELAHFIPVFEHDASPVDLEDADGGTVRTNTGATGQIVFNLPAAAYGRKYTFYVQDSDGLRVVAESGDTIRVGGSVSSSGGYAEASVIGNALTLVGLNSDEWVAVSAVGTWTLA